MSSAVDAAFGVYVHVPYCRHVCPYCEFNVYPLRGSPFADLVDALMEEARLRASAFGPGPAGSLYLGGGTPSLLPVEQAQRLVEGLRSVVGLLPGSEITLEIEPGTVDRAALQRWRDLGVNRVSLGWQSNHDGTLKVLGRGHDGARAREDFATLRKVGFEVINVDLIFAVPGQDLGALGRDLVALQALRPEHVTLYELTYYDGTPFHRRRAAGKLVPVDDDTVVAMLELIQQSLAAAGYERYEVSNYGRDGHRARHNRRYWRGVPTLGLGPGAHSFVRQGFEVGHRWRGRSDPDHYLAALGSASPGVPAADDPSVDLIEELGPAELLAERMFCGLRTTEGVSLGELGGYRERVLAQAQGALDRGWLVLGDGRLQPTAQGLLFADTVAQAFVAG